MARVEHPELILVLVVPAGDTKEQMALVRALLPERVQMSTPAAQTPVLISKLMLAAAAAGLVPQVATAQQPGLVTVEVGLYPPSAVRLLLTLGAAARVGTTAGLVIPPPAREVRVAEGMADL